MEFDLFLRNFFAVDKIPDEIKKAATDAAYSFKRWRTATEQKQKWENEEDLSKKQFDRFQNDYSELLSKWDFEKNEWVKVEERQKLRKFEDKNKTKL